ncbi:MAG: protein translocase subunit SecD [Phycisphaeraceae bacterium]|nr:protein translocase subunit SecD [Phycisphaeraceae bacterium]
MRKPVQGAFWVLVSVLIAIWAIAGDAPPKGFRIGKVSFGKDLAGGVSLVYQVDIKPGDPPDTLARVMEVLKKRVDPAGNLEISMSAQGSDRIEITMPLPSARSKELRAKFDEALARATAGYVTDDDLQLVLSDTPEGREKRIKGLAQGNEDVARLLAETARKYDAMLTARRAYEEPRQRVRDLQAQIAELKSAAPENRQQALIDTAEASLVTAEKQLNALAAAAAPAELEFDRSKQELLTAAVSDREMLSALRRSKAAVRLHDVGTKYIVLPSPREQAIERLKEQHHAAAGRIDECIAAWETYEAERSTLDDPEDLKRLLRGAGVLNFRITVKPGQVPDESSLRESVSAAGPRNAGNEQVGWYKLNKLEGWYSDANELRAVRDNPRGFFASRNFIVEPYEGDYYILCYRTEGSQLTEASGQWRVANAYPGQDQIGRPAIDFEMDAVGGSKLGRLTENNVGNNMAVLLDDEVYTAPVLRDRISVRGQISGSFSPREIDYIVQVLSAGSLQAKLIPDPISESKLGPSLGADNLRRGSVALAISFVAVSAFMVFYYFMCGALSVVALFLNGLLLVGAMALQHAPFTLPGIAGVALTFGIAVDANVLIYERMREELMHGADARTAVRLGYHRALSSIVDGNLTNLIPCIVLGFVGTPEIKGFAITLGIGVVTTLFMQLFATRMLFTLFVDYFGLRRLRMLPMVVPAIHRVLTPNIDWLGLRFYFIAFSVITTLLSIGLVATEGTHLLDTEFRGGTAVTITLKRDPQTGEQVTMKRAQVEERLSKIAAEAPAGSPLKELGNASIIVVNPRSDGVTSSDFTIKTVLTDSGAVQSAVVKAFEDQIESQKRLMFAGAGEDVSKAPVYPVLDPVLGRVIDRPEVTNDVSGFYGGVAILLDGIEPPAPIESIQRRFALARQRPEFKDTLLRQTRVIILSGGPEAVGSAVVVVHDPNVPFRELPQWRRDLASGEWSIVNVALTEETTLASVQNFSAAIARTFRAQAIFSIGLSTLLIVIYVWVRFNSLRYSLAAIIATIHDCVIAVGAVAAASILYEKMPDVAKSLGLMPFKFDLTLVAAVLTILGYSLNDTIIIMDRIREVKGKLPHAGREMVNDAINRTLSRTVITSGTVALSATIIYVFGGEGVRSFAFAMLVGVVAGTYSSFGIAAPIVWVKKYDHLGPGSPHGAPGSVTESASMNGSKDAQAPRALQERR